MFLLLSNDDGYLSQGLRLMAKRLKKEVPRLAVMAPDRDCSGASHSLTLTRPLNVHHHGDGIYSVDGTPSDCVNIALTGYFDQSPDMVISGINRGANLGDDVMYSGTVAAAFEGRHLGLPAIAVSNVAHTPKHLDSSVRIVCDLFHYLQRHPLSANTLLNVNIPDCPYEKIRGMKTTVLGRRSRSGPLIEAKNPRGEVLYWIGPAGSAEDSGQETDFHAVNDGYVSITPLQFDLSHYAQVNDIKEWIKEF